MCGSREGLGSDSPSSPWKNEAYLIHIIKFPKNRPHDTTRHPITEHVKCEAIFCILDSARAVFCIVLLFLNRQFSRWTVIHWFKFSSHSLKLSPTPTQQTKYPEIPAPGEKLYIRACKQVFELNAGSITMSKNDIDIFGRLFVIEINWPLFVVNGVIANKYKPNSYLLI